MKPWERIMLAWLSGNWVAVGFLSSAYDASGWVLVALGVCVLGCVAYDNVMSE